jgi:hypothetical protein
LAHAVLAGLFGRAQASHLMPAILRITHSLEITADSFAYMGVLVWLFVPLPPAAAEEHAKRPSAEIAAGRR